MLNHEVIFKDNVLGEVRQEQAKAVDLEEWIASL